jgi:hypothetical protein
VLGGIVKAEGSGDGSERVLAFLKGGLRGGLQHCTPAMCGHWKRAHHSVESLHKMPERYGS